MQRSYYNGNKKQRFQNRSRGNFGVRRIKSFDPSNIINFKTEAVSEIEYFAKHKFSDFKVSDQLKTNILSKNYTTPTPIQDQAIPAILEGRDIIGMANTGTGKTAAFLIPLIEKVFKNRNEKVLILTPTRELALQINTELRTLTQNMNIYSAVCIGGANIWRQKEDLKRNPNFVIGTPGRIGDLINTYNINLGNFNSVVLDEADHMVDVGFFETIKKMIFKLPRMRQSLFFSATVNEKVKNILSSFVNNPVTISVKTADITTHIRQEIVRILSPNTKSLELERILSKGNFQKVLIFARTKRAVQKLSDSLNVKGFKADAIHGNKNQSQRTKSLSRFRDGSVVILIATDVASRGLDIPDVSHVINYDLPESYEAYIHRVGRTGRAEKNGLALTFIE